MIRKVILTAMLFSMFAPLPGTAREMTKKFALGYHSSEAPLGIRYWYQPTVAFDIGVGFESEDREDHRAESFWIGAGFPLVLHESERVNFVVRPGLLFGSEGDGHETWTTLKFLGAPGAEVFIGDHFSLEAFTGIAIEIEDIPEAYGGGSLTHVRSFSGNLTQFGFHYYFK
jgi:hypothetical protein